MNVRLPDFCVQSTASLVGKVLPLYQLLFLTTLIPPSGLAAKLKYSLVSFVVRRHEHDTPELC